MIHVVNSLPAAEHLEVIVKYRSAMKLVSMQRLLLRTALVFWCLSDCLQNDESLLASSGHKRIATQL